MLFFTIVALISLVLWKPVPASWQKYEEKNQQKQRGTAEDYSCDIAITLELLAAVMTAGSSLYRALEIIAETLHGKEKQELHRVLSMVSLSSSWDQAWNMADGKIRELGTFLKTIPQGSSAESLLRTKATSYHKEQENKQAELIEKLSVKLLMPLGLLALPAFIAIGIVPTVVCLFSNISILP